MNDHPEYGVNADYIGLEHSQLCFGNTKTPVAYWRSARPLFIRCGGFTKRRRRNWKV